MGCLNEAPVMPPSENIRSPLAKYQSSQSYSYLRGELSPIYAQHLGIGPSAHCLPSGGPPTTFVSSAVGGPCAPPQTNETARSLGAHPGCE